MQRAADRMHGAQRKGEGMPAEQQILDAKMQRRLQEDALGKDIIDECRTQLMMKFRFLDLALWRMNLEPMRVGARYPLATDAKRVLYDPPREIARFNDSFEETVRDYLHLVMHCIFRHPFDKNHKNLEAWGLTCDILVESAVMDMCGGRFESEDDVARREAIDRIRMLVGKLLPNKVYTLVKGLVQTPDGQQYLGMGRSTLNDWHALFERDDHGAWPANASNASNNQTSNDTQEVSEDDEDPEAQSDDVRMETQGESEPPEEQDHENQANQMEADVEDAPDSEDDAEEGAESEDAESESNAEEDSDAAQQEKEWEDVSKQIEMNLETFAKEWGEEAGSLMANLHIANRKVNSYTEFLRKFMVVSEEMQVNMDEFDYIYYTYGMDLYGNMPLIEPLEYKETDRVRDFAIVIDTSESVSGDLVKRFITHTFDILKSSQDYATKVNIHVIQCDAKVQSDLKITDLSDIDKLMEGFVIRGFGGTDFRPAFDYVDMLRKRGEFTALKGLIYFTDGLGQFPEKTPDYDAAFVFMDEEGRELPPVPPWAMKVVVDEAGLSQLDSKSA